ncbi:Fc.00g077940.m01.CDS01 [Cosmosporella sp. VM-42]
MKLLLRSTPRLSRRYISLTCRTFASEPSLDQTLKALTSRPSKTIPDYLTPMPSHLLTTTLSDLLQTPHPSSSTIQSPAAVLPQGHHLVYFPIQSRPSALIPDGADPDHSPGEPFTRRVWAGGQVKFGKRWRDMRLDCREVVCRETVRRAEVKGTGEKRKVVVDVWREYGLGHQDGERGEWEVEELRTLVFMPTKEEDDSPASPSRIIKTPHEPTYRTTITPTPTHLFHFSALSFNAHSIHIDPLFAQRDGHRALLVHGPLTLALILRVLGEQIGSGYYVQNFAYRNFAPLYVGEALSICVRPVLEGRWDVWVEGPHGGLAVRGSAVIKKGSECDV